MINRRNFVKATLAGAALTTQQPFNQNVNAKTSAITIEPKAQFELSPYLFMQFMEPLGTTDGSVSAGWDYKSNRWRSDLIKVAKKLSPPLIRWGGCLSSFYRWKEAVGRRKNRKPMLNIKWGGIEPNQVGTHEIIDFCEKVGADPLMSVNFESDGRKKWMTDSWGQSRCADAQEAAEWVDYCNNPDNKLRIKHGIKQPYKVKLWQLGNETSYDRKGFNSEIAAKKMVIFAKSMRKVDPSIKLIGWGENRHGKEWVKHIVENAGEHLQYIAFHHMFDPARGKKDSPLKGIEYRKNPAKTWEYLMKAYIPHQEKIEFYREQVKGSNIPLAMTECHFSLPGRNRCEVLSSWAAGVSYARMTNVHIRNGDVLKIATLSDFFGTRWMVNSLIIPVPKGKSFMLPVGRIMWFYRKHMKKHALKVTNTPAGLDVTASRTNDKICFHVINTKRTQSVKCALSIGKKHITTADIYEMSTDPSFEIISSKKNPLIPKHRVLNSDTIIFPPASVSMVECTDKEILSY